MMELFDPQIDRIIKLISDQVEAAARKNAKIDVSIAIRWNFVKSNDLATLPRRWLRGLALPQLSGQGVVRLKSYPMWHSRCMVR
jgi:hypothetical protein